MTTANEIEDGKTFLKKILADNVKLILFLEFLINTYTYSIWSELVLVPVLSLIVMTATYAELKPEFKDAAKVLSWTQAIIGFAVLYFAVQKLNYLLYGQAQEFVL